MPRQTRSTAKPAATTTTPALPALYTYTIGMYEVEHSGDIEHVMDALYKNGLIVSSIIEERDFTEFDSETGAVVLTSPMRPEAFGKVVNGTSFTNGWYEGNQIDMLEGEARADQDHDDHDEYGDDLEHDGRY